MLVWDLRGSTVGLTSAGEVLQIVNWNAFRGGFSPQTPFPIVCSVVFSAFRLRQPLTSDSELPPTNLKVPLKQQCYSDMGTIFTQGSQACQWRLCRFNYIVETKVKTKLDAWIMESVYHISAQTYAYFYWKLWKTLWKCSGNYWPAILVLLAVMSLIDVEYCQCRLCHLYFSAMTLKIFQISTQNVVDLILQ